MQTKTQMWFPFVNWIEYAHVTTQRIAKKVIEIKISVGCMVWPRCCLFQHGLPVKLLIRSKLQIYLESESNGVLIGIKTS